MKIFSSLRDNKTKRYWYYYMILLSIISITILLMSFGVIEFLSIEGALVFVEGFVALYMLSRHENAKNGFFSHFTKGLKF